MGSMASQITSLTIVYSTVYSGADQREHQCSASLAFVRGIHRWPVNSPHKWPVTRKMFPFDDIIMRARNMSLFLLTWESYFWTNYCLVGDLRYHDSALILYDWTQETRSCLYRVLAVMYTYVNDMSPFIWPGSTCAFERKSQQIRRSWKSRPYNHQRLASILRLFWDFVWMGGV